MNIHINVICINLVPFFHTECVPSEDIGLHRTTRAELAARSSSAPGFSCDTCSHGCCHVDPTCKTLLHVLAADNLHSESIQVSIKYHHSIYLDYLDLHYIKLVLCHFKGPGGGG